MIYLDHAAGTSIEPAAVDAMATAAREMVGHPGSTHAGGRRIHGAVERAQIQVAEYLGCSPAEVLFCGGTGQALALALHAAHRWGPGPVWTSAVEHPRMAQVLAGLGGPVHVLPARRGAVDAVGFSTVLGDSGVVALSACNHELGTAPALVELMASAPDHWWVVDAAQAAPWLDLRPLWIDRALVVVTSHKLGGPPGPAALRVPARCRVAFEAHPSYDRGTPPWLDLIGFGAACAARTGRVTQAHKAAMGLAQELFAQLARVCPDLVHNRGADWAVPILNVSIPGVSGRALESAMDLRGVAISRTSACRQRSDGGSEVVRAAFPEQSWRSETCTRWSLGWSTTAMDIRGAVAAFEQAWPGLSGQLAFNDRSGANAGGEEP